MLCELFAANYVNVTKRILLSVGISMYHLNAMKNSN